MTLRGFVLLPLLLLAACSAEEHEVAEPVRPVRSMVVEAQRPMGFSLPGTVEPRIESRLGFRVLGRIVTRNVETGDTVARNDVLAELDPTALDLAVRSAEADYISARAQLAEAAGVAFRQSELLQARAATQANFEAADRQRRTAEALAASNEAKLAKAREQRSYAELRADFDGVVLATYAEVGQVVNPGQPVLTLARPDIREAVVDIPDEAAALLTPGMSFNVFLELDRNLRVVGTIREIAPSADPATRTRRVRISLDNPSADFRLGSTVRVTPGQEMPLVIRVPDTAVLTEGDNSFVFIVDEQAGVARKQAVKVEPAPMGGKIVVSGVESGSRIATAGVHTLRDGQAVKLGGGGL
ncbi:efflux RND transporter periplasmic adaptor subunit [Aureimonas fodinaquatilis]|uniref:Efflux RND transporter periplasmic adaptor subunit n=1 Tax=Aureimonas fodinaquatilis TaxID=2565783 RepID=A0A5B0DSI9_9HYPH|nr:efflux RND transporter periplasmic adaptor subunit [Aureimonas fodinaquatilis]KAA0969353.1 efflux RND transporter periplasmic adaptor subunit [Aureimonas fodinaquatilis]